MRAVRRLGLAAALVVLIALPVRAVSAAASSGQALPARAAVQVVRAYIAALDRHDGTAVCRLFSARLRSYEVRWDAASSSPSSSCSETVDAHFRDYISRHRWASAQIRGRPTITIDAKTAVAAVRMTLVHRYICAPKASAPGLPEHCNPGHYVRPDIVYLIERAGRWQIIKPGLVYAASETAQPIAEDAAFYPPGTPSTVDGPVTASSSTAVCPAGVTVVSPPHALGSPVEPNPRGGPGSEPWLRIESISAARLTPRTMCFTLALAGPPRPDSEYSIEILNVQQDSAPSTFDVDFDGLGAEHPLRAGRGVLSDPGMAPYLPRIYVVGTQLQFVATDQFFTRSRFLVSASSVSIQTGEPLLTRPLDAGDVAPVRACLAFPSGKLERDGMCAGPSG